MMLRWDTVIPIHTFDRFLRVWFQKYGSEKNQDSEQGGCHGADENLL